MRETRKKRSRAAVFSPFWVAVAALSLACGALWMVVVSRPLREALLGPDLPTLIPTGVAQATAAGNTAASCQQLIDRALQASSNSCSQIGSNKVCYGNVTLQAALRPGTSGRFEQKGDIIDVANLLELSAAPLDLDSQEWGIAIFKLLANLPRTLPGENITFIVFGNTTLSSAAGNLEAFYFSSGVGRVACEQVPFDGILVQMADGAGLRFAANGAQVTLLGRASLQAHANESMTVSMLSGSAVVSANGVDRYFGAGQQVDVPLGGAGGMQASGPPSEPSPLPSEVLQTSCTLTGSACNPGDINAVSPSEAQTAVNQVTGVDGPGTQVAVIPTAVVATASSTATQAVSATGTPGPSPTPSRTPTMTRTGTSIPGASPTPTAGANTATSTPANTATPAAQNGNPSLTPTRTPTKTLTYTPSPSHTPTATLLRSNTPTHTQAATATDTPPPTATDTPPPTPTETPPPSPTTESCDVSAGGLSPNGIDLLWTVQNNMSATVSITAVTVNWVPTPASQKVKEMWVDSVEVWMGALNTPPSTIPSVPQPWMGAPEDRDVGPESSRTIRLVFQDALPASGNAVITTFSNGCMASAGN